MRHVLADLIEVRNVSRYRLGRLCGLDVSRMGWFYQALTGARPIRHRALCRILTTINEIKPLTEEESVQIVQALLEAGNDDQ